MRALLAKIDSSPPLKVILFLVALAVFGGPAFLAAERAADGYAGKTVSNWDATNVWLKSTECARQTGAWLAWCDGGKLRPLNDSLKPDDPGHALLLDIYAAASKQPVDLSDVVRLNTFINVAAFVLFAAFLLACRAYVTLLVLLILGPYEFVGWQSDMPHWGYIGATFLAAILPLSILARDRGWLSPRTGHIFIAIGLLALAFAALIREAIGLMALIITASVVVGTFAARREEQRRAADLLSLAILVAVAWLAPRWVILARDATFTMQPAAIIQSHGLSHTLYTTLVAIEKNVPHLDKIGEDDVHAAAPDVVTYSPEYFRVLWRLYFRLVLDDPAAAARAYLIKTRSMLTDTLLEPAPPLWLSIVLALGFLGITWRRWPALGFDAGRFIMLVCLAFVAFFVAQGILALPTRLFSFPAGRLLLVVLGCAAEFLVRLSWRRLTARASPAARS